MALIPFGEFLQAVRRRRFPRLSLRQVAERLKISPAHLSMIERGERSPSLRLVHQASVVFGISEHWLLLFCPNLEEKEQNKRLNAWLKKNPFKLTGLDSWIQKADLKTFHDAIKDPDLRHSRRFRKPNPKVPKHLIALIAELYRNWLIEREERERLEKQFLGRVTKRYRKKSKLVPLPERKWQRKERQQERREREAVIEDTQRMVMANLEKVLALAKSPSN
jgi:transcriptional regulator with XRE-family HTH domain